MTELQPSADLLQLICEQLKQLPVQESLHRHIDVDRDLMALDLALHSAGKLIHVNGLRHPMADFPMMVQGYNHCVANGHVCSCRRTDMWRYSHDINFAHHCLTDAKEHGRCRFPNPCVSSKPVALLNDGELRVDCLDNPEFWLSIRLPNPSGQFIVSGRHVFGTKRSPLHNWIG